MSAVAASTTVKFHLSLNVADLDFSGTSSFNNGAAYTVIVVDQLLISGGAYVNLNSNYSGLANNGGPLSGVTQWATLVE